MSSRPGKLHLWSSILYIVLSLFPNLVLGVTDTRPCYDVKNELVDHKPCVSEDSQAFSHCCSRVDTCLNDTLCLSQWGTLYVGTCTLPDWTSNNGQYRKQCPMYCTDWYEKNRDPSIGLCSQEVVPFQFCCDVLQGTEKCCNGSLFHIGNTAFENAEEATLSSISSSSASSSATATASATASACPPLSDNGNKNNTAIGLGVGLGLPLVATILLLFWEFHKRRLAEARLEQDKPHAIHHSETSHFFPLAYQQNSYPQPSAELNITSRRTQELSS